MTLAQSLYKSYLFVAGTALIVLGLGNYFVATSKTGHYQKIMAETAPQMQKELLFISREERFPFPSEAREHWEIAHAKRDFYQVVLSAGRLMSSVGLLCAAFSLMHLRRHRSRLT
jgi:hypothetical protein